MLGIQFVQFLQGGDLPADKHRLRRVEPAIILFAQRFNLQIEVLFQERPDGAVLLIFRER